ncbi:DUF2934 domain-containing protein [Luteolibacter ambystomatis]|uniref:DUF2934 domain-containing protein n=1 Tax=Luteolibacter ambystomatis TaxID=2824561 RepID=A0A975J1B8_9BACT|nr:DUF2934 domain-containing protein [Luteolibacter ambystomatis]QUE52216.1 DUF2934 domain-containing protein [Luteolibacter ambystomatis]
MSRRIILDKSFLQAEARNCNRLRLLREAGYTFVVIDTLAYEFSTGRGAQEWGVAQRKLFEFSDHVEIWTHIGELLRKEVRMGVPTASPIDDDLTYRMRELWKNGNVAVASEGDPAIQRSRAEREVDSTDAMADECRNFSVSYPEYAREVKRRVGAGIDVGPLFVDLLHNEKLIQAFVRRDHGDPADREVYIVGAESGLNHEWLAYRLQRSHLAAKLLFMMKYEVGTRLGKEFINTKLDFDYIEALHFADAIATNETSGSLGLVCDWLYGPSKPRISTNFIDGVMPSEQSIRERAFFLWECSGRRAGDDLAHWLEAELLAKRLAWPQLLPM